MQGTAILMCTIHTVEHSERTSIHQTILNLNYYVTIWVLDYFVPSEEAFICTVSSPTLDRLQSCPSHTRNSYVHVTTGKAQYMFKIGV